LRIICITGMHRSGTSVVARIVNLLGVELGPPDEHIPSSKNNPRGFWEHQAIKDFNARLLSELGGSWRRPPRLVDGWEHARRLDPHRKEAVALLADILGDADLAGWKDPRTSLLLPFWRSVCALERTVLTVRHPQEVAASLLARNGFDPEQTADLWLRYTVAAWRDDPDCVLVDYAQLFEDRDGAVRRLAEELGLELTSDAHAAIREFFDPGLRHHDARPPAGPTMALAEVVYAQLRTASPRELLPLAQVVHQHLVADDGKLLEAAQRRARRAEAELQRIRGQRSRLERYEGRRALRATVAALGKVDEAKARLRERTQS
jgi:hypothetical protein